VRDWTRATVGASSITLGSLLKHLAYVEDDRFSPRLHGRDRQPPWDAADWKADPDWDWHSAADDSAERLHALWQDTVAHSRALVAEALAEVASPNWPSAPGSMAGRPACAGSWSTWIEEYARHNGHADLLRESVDGQTGE
jgi:hypothetical protein